MCWSWLSNLSPNIETAIIFEAAAPAERPDATKSAGSTAVLMRGNRISAEMRKPVYAQIVSARTHRATR